MTAAPATSNPRVPSAFLLGVVSRFLQGFAAFAPIVYCFRLEVDWGMLTPSIIATAAVTSGLGLGAAVDRRSRSVWGTAGVIRISLLILAVGLWMLWLTADAELLIALAFLLGLVSGSEWSSLADVTRKSLHNAQRWQGVRCWTVSFFVGVAIAIAAPSIISESTLIAAMIASLCVVASLQIDLSTSEDIVDTISTAEVTTQPVEESEDCSSIDATDECDATQCCGGSKTWTQTSFRHGALLSMVGWFALFGVLQLLAQQSWALDQWLPPVILASGFVIGGLLIFSVAPATGYAVSLLPFLLLAIPLTIARHTFDWTGMGNAAVLFGSGIAFAAVHCGIKLVIGELFSDCSTDPARTRIVAVSLFATSIIIPFSVAMKHMLPSGGWQAVPTLIVLACGLATLRTLPSPVVSSLGEDNPDELDMDELEDVMATINN